ncbi:ABC transporter permease subunit [Winogradskyella maritima]|uniref:ABC transporter permease n=1 Tax=Winogradskyella maritima TaxID=1517766 RepID=A0ABV8AMW4_9FLAO|nr:ABC transporter permease subunit [Winogradskyella maritima]
MLRLIQLELQKLWLNRTSKVLIFISFILPLFIVLISSFKIPFFGYFTLELGEYGLFNFPLIWHLVTFFASQFKFFFAIVVVSMIGNEYSNKTLKQNLIDGLSKREFILSKFYTISFFSLVSTLIIAIMTLCIGFFYSSYTEFGIVTRDLEFLVGYFVKLVGFFSLCLFFGMLAKRSAFALAFLFVLYCLEWIAYGIIWKFSTEELATNIQNFFPLKSMYKLIDVPFLRIAATVVPDNKELIHDYAVHFHEVAIVLGWTAVFIFLSYRLLKKRDL